MQLSFEAVAAIALTLNAAICASVPVEIKKQAPMLWAVLDAFALNVRHATNRLDSSSKWQQGVAAAVVGAVLSLAALRSAPSAPAPLVVAQAPAMAIGGWPPVGADLPVPVSPAEAATEATGVVK